jgi:hypothetical protein
MSALGQKHGFRDLHDRSALLPITNINSYDHGFKNFPGIRHCAHLYYIDLFRLTEQRSQHFLQACYEVTCFAYTLSEVFDLIVFDGDLAPQGQERENRTQAWQHESCIFAQRIRPQFC